MDACCWPKEVYGRQCPQPCRPGIAILLTEIILEDNATCLLVNRHSGTPDLQYEQYSCTSEVVQSISLLLVFPLLKIL